MYIEEDFPIEKLTEIALKESSAKKPIYQIHKWWARRLGSIFRMIMVSTFSENLNERELWRNYYSNIKFKDKIILDPFMGGGTTVFEALSLGCKVIGIDIQPLSWLITKKEIELVDLKLLESEFKKIERKIKDKMLSYYKTVCPNCDSYADSMYILWVKEINCFNCKFQVQLFNSFIIAKKKDYIVNICPNCKNLAKIKKDRNKLLVICEECNYQYNLKEGFASGQYYICPECGQKGKILESLSNNGEPPMMEMFAIEYYCPTCNTKDYKKVDAYDLKIFKDAKEEFKKLKNNLIGNLIPYQKIPNGEKTKELLNYKYEYFFQMFNERQLLCLSFLLDEIRKINNFKVMEFFLLTFSTLLEYNTIFCTYHPTRYIPKNLFSLHAYWHPNLPLENNVWGTKYGSGTFSKFFQKLKRAKTFNIQPFEKKINKDKKVKKIFLNNVIKSKIAKHFEDLNKNDPNVILRCQTSEDLSFITGKVDVVITDPPYYDNVMYSELADFFYVWIRLVLKDKYEWFVPELSPRLREIIKNKVQNKDNQFFIDGLTRVFTECYKVLKDNGLLIFTFHHKETKAWASALTSILNSNFYVKAVYPIHSEMRTSMHILSKKAIQYDTIIVCKKRQLEEKSMSWEKLKDQIYSNAKQMITNLWNSERNIADIDIFVITIGKSLELYSKYYPDVLREGKQISIKTAIEEIEGIVDSLIKSRDLEMLPSFIDELTRLFILYLSDREAVSFDEINKLLRTGGSEIDLFFKANLIFRKGNLLKIRSPSERFDFIQNKINKNKELLYIDKIHFLYNLYKMNKPITKYINEWGDNALIEIASLLYKKTGEVIYQKVSGTLEVIPKQKRKVKKIITTKITEFLEENND